MFKKILIVVAIFCFFVPSVVCAEMAPQFNKNSTDKADLSKNAPQSSKINRNKNVMESNAAHKNKNVMESNTAIKNKNVMESNAPLKNKNVMEHNAAQTRQVHKMNPGAVKE